MGSSTKSIPGRNAASSIISDAEIADVIDAPHSWQIEDIDPVLRFEDEGMPATEFPWERPADPVMPL